MHFSPIDRVIPGEDIVEGLCEVGNFTLELPSKTKYGGIIPFLKVYKKSMSVIV